MTCKIHWHGIPMENQLKFGDLHLSVNQLEGFSEANTVVETNLTKISILCKHDEISTQKNLLSFTHVINGNKHIFYYFCEHTVCWFAQSFSKELAYFQVAWHLICHFYIILCLLM